MIQIRTIEYVNSVSHCISDDTPYPNRLPDLRRLKHADTWCRDVEGLERNYGTRGVSNWPRIATLPLAGNILGLASVGIISLPRSLMYAPSASLCACARLITVSHDRLDSLNRRLNRAAWFARRLYFINASPAHRGRVRFENDPTLALCHPRLSTPEGGLWVVGTLYRTHLDDHSRQIYWDAVYLVLGSIH